MTKREAARQFREEVLPAVPKGDRPALFQAWNDWTDGLCKDGRVTRRQYDMWTNPFG